MSLFTKHSCFNSFVPYVPPVPPEPIVRKISGYSLQGSSDLSPSTIKIKINNEVVFVNRNVENGYFELILQDDFVITSLYEAFSANVTGYGYEGKGIITYLDLRNIGDLSQCESMYNLCYNQASLSAITFSSTINTEKVNSLRGAFNGCMSLAKLDLSNFDTSSIVGKGDLSMGTLLYMNEPNAAITSLKLPYLHQDNYLGGGTFTNCTNLSNIEFNVIDTVQSFASSGAVLRLNHCTLSAETIANLLSEKGICHLSSYSFERLIEVNMETYMYITQNYSSSIYRSYGWIFLVSE